MGLGAVGYAGYQWYSTPSVSAQAIDNANDKAKSFSPAAAHTTCESCKKDPCEALRCGAPGSLYRGGAHGCTKGPIGDGLHSHHTPSNDAAGMGDEGPAIQMDPLDHYKTASYGSTIPAKKYRDEQKAMIAEGNFVGATLKDVADIRSKFGNRYDEAIAQMSAYTACLKQNGRIK